MEGFNNEMAGAIRAVEKLEKVLEKVYGYCKVKEEGCIGCEMSYYQEELVKLGGRLRELNN